MLPLWNGYTETNFTINVSALVIEAIPNYTDFDGGILDEPEWNMCEARDAILKDFDWDGRLMTLIDYDELMEHV